MQNQKKEASNAGMQDIGTSRLIDELSDELSRIADEIEKFPIALGHEYSAEEIEMLQSIDFCGQKLKDIARVLGVISAQADSLNVDRTLLDQSVKIEAIRSIVL